MIWMVSPNFQLIYANEAYMRRIKQVTGKEKKINTSVFEDAFGDESVKKWEAYYNRAIKGETFELEEKHTDPNTNKVHYSLVTLKPIYGDKQEVEAVACQSKEIGQFAEQRFKALVQEGSDLIGVINSEGVYSYVSPTSLSILGIPAEAFIGKNAFDFIHEKDQEGVRNALKDVATTHKVKLKPFRFRNNDNDWRWVETVLTNMLDNPAVEGIVANSRDVTERIAQQKKVKQAEKRFETLVQNSADCVAIISPEAKTLFISERVKGILGYTASEALDMDIRELIHPEDTQGVEKALAQAVEQPGVSIEGHTSRIKHKDGSWRWVKATITNLIHDPSIGGIVDVFSDVTKEKNEELEKELIIDIGKVFNQNTDNDLSHCLSVVCERLVDFGDCSFAELWLPDIDKKVLNCTARYAGTEVGKTFFEATKDVRTLTLDEGAQSQVFKSKKTVLWQADDATMDSTKRKLAAQKVGIKTLVGIPLIHNKEVIGGLLLGTEKTKSALIGNSELFEKLESSIGSELSRKKTKIELEQIFNYTPDIICIVGFDGYIKRINPAGLDLFGYSLEEVRSRPIQSFVHKEDQPQSERNLSSLYEGNNLKNFENRFITKEGKVVWLSWTATTLPEQSIIYAVAKDVTEDKNLRELNRQVGLLAKIGSWEVDLVNNSVFWTKEVHLLHETDPSSFTPTLEGAINFYREDFQELVKTNVEKCIRTGEPYEMEAVLITANNKEVWVRTNGSAEFIDGECVRIYGSIQDIDERKKSENKLVSLSQNLPGIIYEYHIHPDGTDSIESLSGKVKDIWGFTASEVLENPALVWKQVEVGGDKDLLEKSIRQSIETKSQWQCRTKYVMPLTGKMRTHLGYGTPKFLTDGTIVFNSIILDVTKEAQYEELLDQTSKIAKIGSWEMDLMNQEGDKMYWSPAINEILELEKDYKPTLKKGIEFHVGESKERIKHALELLITEGIEFDEEILLRTAKGNERWTRAIGKSEVVNGKRTRIYGSYQEINERKVATLNLEKSLSELQDYKYSLDQSAIIAFTDNKGKITSVNDNFCEISGYSRKELIGQTHSLINAGYHSKAFFRDLWKTIASGKVFRSEIKNKAKDGSFYWVDTTIVPFLDKKQKPKQYLAIRFDITERKKAEDEKAKFQETLENSLNEIYMFDAKTLKFSYVNRGALLNLGYSNKEIKALTPLDLKPSFTVSKFNERIAPLIKHKKSKIVFFTNHLRKDGSQYPVEVHLKLVEEGDKKNFIAIILDITDRKKAQEELLSTSERLRLATSSVKMGIWDWDIVNDNLKWDDRMYQLYGVRRQDFSGALDAWQNGIHPDDALRANEDLQDALSGKREFNLVFRVIWPDKSIHFIQANAIVSRDEEGNAIRMIGSNLDVTDRKKTEEEILLANQRFEKVTEATNDVIWDWDIVNDMFYRSDAIEQFFGKKVKKSLKQTDFWTDSFHPDDVKKVDDSITRAISDSSVSNWEMEYRILNEEGEVFFVLDRGIIIRNEKGKAIRMVGAMANITKQKRSEQEIKFQANLLKTVGQAAVASDLEGIVTYWNKAATSIYGWTREEAIGRNIEMLTPSNADQNQIEQIMALLKEGKTWTGDIVVQKKDGTTFPARASNSPVYDKNKQLVGMIGISSDITQEVEHKKLIEEYTQKLEKSNQDLANRIQQIKKQNEKFQKISWLQSHEVRAPLVRILGIVELIDSSDEELDDLPFWLEQLKLSSKEMDEVIKAVVQEADAE